VSSPSILTLDLGTSSLKAVLWSIGGSVVADASVSYELDRPAPGWAEIDADRWWAALVRATSTVRSTARVAAADVIAIAVDGMGWTPVAVDAGFRAVAPAPTWLDRRAEAEAAGLRARADADALVDLVANRIDAAYITPQLAWLAAHEPRRFDAARWFLTASGYLVARLTGEAGCDDTQAYGFHCFDIRCARWDATVAASLGIPPDRLPWARCRRRSRPSSGSRLGRR
jgi:xylulokinase